MIIFRPWRWQYGTRSGTRAIVPSSFMISQTTPDGLSPASRARSTEASVWPIRSRTPPAFARSGKMWPGWTRSCGFVSGWIATWMVWLRSAAEMPVVTPSRASTETVNAVPSGASLWSVIGRRPSWSVRSSVRQRQISPRACVAMKLIASGRRKLGGDHEVALVLAVRVVDDDDEPSRANILDRLFDGRERRLLLGHDHPDRLALRERAKEPLDVLREHVDLEIDGVARPQRAEGRLVERVRDQRDGEAGVVERGDRQTGPLDRDRALLDDVAEQVGRRVEPEAPPVAFAARPLRTVPTPSTWPWT